jgi:hypothetical protein
MNAFSKDRIQFHMRRLCVKLSPCDRWVTSRAPGKCRRRNLVKVRNLLLIILAGMSLAGMMTGAEKPGNFSGKWILDPSHSDASQTAHNSGITSVLSGIVGGKQGGAEPPNAGAQVDVDDQEGDVGGGVPGELAGEWIVDRMLLIVQTDSELQTTRQLFTVDGNEKTIIQKFALDGSRSINLASNGNGEFESRMSWKDGKWINTGTQTIFTRYERREIAATEEYSLSKDGQRLTIKTKRITPRGVTIIKQVFNKRGTPKS